MLKQISTKFNCDLEFVINPRGVYSGIFPTVITPWGGVGFLSHLLTTYHNMYSIQTAPIKVCRLLNRE